MNANVTVDGASIRNNSASVIGGGVFVGFGSDFQMTSGILYGNTAVRAGDDLSSNFMSTTTIMPATNMGFSTNVVDGWYWDMEPDRFSTTTSPVEYTPITNDGAILDIVAATLNPVVAVNPKDTSESTPILAINPQTGDSSSYPVEIFCFGACVGIALLCGAVLLLRQKKII